MVPYDASILAENHSNLAGLLAGFALAGFFLLIEHRKSAPRFDHDASCLLVFTSFAVGASAAFLYSAASAEVANSTAGYLAVQFPNGLFAIESTVLLVGLNSVSAAFDLAAALPAIRWFSRVVMAVAATTIYLDLDQTYRLMWRGDGGRLLLLVAFVAPLLVALALRRLSQTGGLKAHQLFTWAAMTSVLLLGAPFLLRYRLRYRPHELSFVEVMLIMVSVSGLLAWAGVLLLQRPRGTDGPRARPTPGRWTGDTP